MTKESPQWDHGRHTIDGKTVFVVEQNGNISRLHLVSFPKEVEEEQIRDLMKKRVLRGVTQDEWKVFIRTTPKQTLKSADFDIALMFTGQRDDSEAEFQATMVYDHDTGHMEMISNWTQRYWEPDTGFLFAEKK